MRFATARWPWIDTSNTARRPSSYSHHLRGRPRRPQDGGNCRFSTDLPIYNFLLHYAEAFGQPIPEGRIRYHAANVTVRVPIDDAARADLHAAVAEVRKQVGDIAGSRALFVPMERQVGNVFSALDVFLMASPSEGFSFALAEAMYCGTPVVSTPVGIVPELERDYGLVVSPVSVDPSPEEMARAIEYALTPAFRNDVVPRAREAVIQRYTAGAMARRWTGYLNAVCGVSKT